MIPSTPIKRQISNKLWCVTTLNFTPRYENDHYIKCDDTASWPALNPTRAIYSWHLSIMTAHLLCLWNCDAELKTAPHIAYDKLSL